ncbi:MAG TPA: sulfite exporter TauE/SafE family protein [Ignavibacteriaceae bacterium]|nr:sulfite exporter TauE/SafE family protein [Ignavibacteriaceae bacterium]
MELLGYIAAILIGISLGLIGSGGSILTVPVLVYLLNVDPVTATAYSLFIVGLTSLVGSASYMQKDLVSYKTAIVFSVPSFIAVFITRKFILPAIPDIIFTIGDFLFTKDLFVMIFFAVLMILAAISMIKNNKPDIIVNEQSFNYPLIMVEGFIVGILTGLVGAGGGFLIIPALVLLAKLPMKIAVGTSLLIIAAKSLIGFTGDLGIQREINWGLLFLVSLLAVSGIFAGSYLSKFISSQKLKPAFGWFVMLMGVYIIGKELILQ